MSFYNVFDEALEQYNSNQDFLRWIADELRIHPTISLEQIKKLPGKDPEEEYRKQVYLAKYGEY